MTGIRRRGEVKVGPLIVLGLLAVVTIAYYWFRSSQSKTEVAAVQTTAVIGWCDACKKPFTVAAADVAGIAKQGDKLQCPVCKKFEAQWGSPSENKSTGVMMP